MTVTAATETVFPAVGKGMPDVISYLDEVPWSTAADVKPMKKSVMTESFTWPGYLPSGLYSPTTPYLFFSLEADDMEGELDTTINAWSKFISKGIKLILQINFSIEPV